MCPLGLRLLFLLSSSSCNLIDLDGVLGKSDIGSDASESPLTDPAAEIARFPNCDPLSM